VAWEAPISAGKEVQATLRWRSADQQQHAIRHQVSFMALGRGCLGGMPVRRQVRGP
jgi:hypothetical protein